jgi:DNA invertase Pin-like site-specific DNA recombinase
MKFGYIRVSTRDQNVDRQIDALELECDEVFIDRISGKKANRPGLIKMMDKLRAGDQIIVLRLSRFGRSSKDLATLAEQILGIGATLHSKKEGFNLDGSPMGKMLYAIMGALAEFERDVLSERTREGLAAAARRGRVGGRPKGLSADGKRKAKLVAQLYRDDNWSIKQISENVGVSITTIYNYLKHEGIRVGTRFTKTGKTGD